MVEPAHVEIEDLRAVPLKALQPLLTEEEHTWLEELAWDYRPSQRILSRHIDARALPGFVARMGGEPAGYCFYLFEGRKGLLGNLYVCREHAQPGLEIGSRLVRAALDVLCQDEHVRRVEAQLVPFGPSGVEAVFAEFGFERFLRQFLYRRLDGPSLPDRPSQEPHGCYLDPWQGNLQESAQLLSETYREHIDARLNDQYRSAEESLRFLRNIIQYPGCGVHLPEHCWTVRENLTGRLMGLLLVSEVAGAVAHITQVCVHPGWHGRGLGHLLLRQTLEGLARTGFEGVSLTVTSDNRPALSLYRQWGFELLREFSAFARDL